MPMNEEPTEGSLHSTFGLSRGRLKLINHTPIITKRSFNLIAFAGQNQLLVLYLA